MVKDITTLRITKTLRDWLAKQAIHKAESFDEILRRLLHFKESDND